MNSGITISFIIGGLVLVSILSLNNRLTQFSGNSTLDTTVKNRIETIAELMTNDFQKIDSNLPEHIKPFEIVQDKKVVFNADVYFGDNRQYSKVQWEFQTDNPYEASSNPNDYKLVRSDNAAGGSGNTETIFPTTHFHLEYLDSNGNIVQNLPANRNLIRQIRVEVICEATESASQNSKGEKIYPRAVWTKTFYPPSLQYNNQ